MSAPPKRTPALVSVVEVKRRLKEKGVRVEGGLPHLIAHEMERVFVQMVNEGVDHLEEERSMRVTQGLKRGNPALGRRHLNVDLGKVESEGCASVEA